MSAILALATALVLIVLGILRGKRAAQRALKPVLVRRYVHPGHTWVRLTDDGYAVVGMDEFSQSLIGTIDEVKLPGLLRRVQQGGVAWHVWHGHRLVPLVSPVSGWVVEKNEMVMHNPTLINTSPYNDGWLFKVRPVRLKNQWQNLFTGKTAHQWQDAARAQLSRFFSGTPALMFQDGGVLLEDLADRCSDEEWEEVAQQFFLADKADVERRAAKELRRKNR